MAISIQQQDIRFKLKQSNTIKAWIKKIIVLEKKKCGQLNFVFTNDETLLKTNIEFLKHNTYTDIITFDYCEGSVINGDVLISVERVEENAKKFKTSFDEELKRVMIHGVLHLCGYMDKTKKDIATIRKKEASALARF